MDRDFYFTRREYQYTVYEIARSILKHVSFEIRFSDFRLRLFFSTTILIPRQLSFQVSGVISNWR